MAIKFAANESFRIELKQLMTREPWLFNQGEQDVLNGFLTELEGLAVSDRVDDPGTRLVGPHVSLRVDLEFLELSMDPPRTAALYFEVHGLLKDKFVPIELYMTLGRALDEIRVTNAHPDLKIAIDGAIRIYHSNQLPILTEGFRTNSFCPRVAIEKFNRSCQERR